MNYVILRALRVLILAAALAAAGLLAGRRAPAQAVDETPPPSLAWVSFDGDESLQSLADHLDVWEVQREPGAAGGRALALLTVEEQAWLAESGIAFEIDAARTHSALQVVEADAGQAAGIPGYACYRTVEETYANLAALAAENPSLATWSDIGDSWDKTQPGGPPGYDIHALKLTNRAAGGSKPALFILGATHAREYVTAETAARFAEYLASRYGVDPEVTWLLDWNEVYIVPMGNPDGRKLAENQALWRKNADNDDGCSNATAWGVDLNRNHSFKWVNSKGGLAKVACEETFSGPGAASEPEVQALQAYLSGLYPDRRGAADSDPAPADTAGLFITLHSYGNEILFPWGFTKTASPNYTQLMTLGRKLGFINGYTPKKSADLYLTNGTTDDWAYGERGVAAYTFEMGTAFLQDCASFESSIYPKNREALLYALKAARRPYQSPAGPETLAVSATVSGATLSVSARADDARTQVGEPVQAVVAARLTLDATSWAGAPALALAAADGAFNSAVETLRGDFSTAGWSSGRHTLLVESQDAAGNWGPPSAAFACASAAPSGVTLSPSLQERGAIPGQVARFPILVTNTAAVSDSYRVTISSGGWEATLEAPLGSLSPCAAQRVTLLVRVPVGAANGARQAVTVTVTSTLDGQRRDSRTLTVRSEAGWQVFMPIGLKK